MKTAKRKKGLCLLISVILVLAGMCLGDKALAGFSYAEKEKSGVSFCAVQQSPVEQAMCTDEQLGILEMDDLIEAKGRQADKGNGRLFILRSLAVVHPESLLQYSLVTSAEKNLNHFSNTVIISYVHHQDGQKAEHHKIDTFI